MDKETLAKAKGKLSSLENDPPSNGSSGLVAALVVVLLLVFFLGFGYAIYWHRTHNETERQHINAFDTTVFETPACVALLPNPCGDLHVHSAVP